LNAVQRGHSASITLPAGHSKTRFCFPRFSGVTPRIPADFKTNQIGGVGRTWDAASPTPSRPGDSRHAGRLVRPPTIRVGSGGIVHEFGSGSANRANKLLFDKSSQVTPISQKSTFLSRLVGRKFDAQTAEPQSRHVRRKCTRGGAAELSAAGDRPATDAVQMAPNSTAKRGNSGVNSFGTTLALLETRQRRSKNRLTTPSDN
jgi:hypothetical protein